jgi:hypothetical protein
VRHRQTAASSIEDEKSDRRLDVSSGHLLTPVDFARPGRWIGLVLPLTILLQVGRRGQYRDRGSPTACLDWESSCSKRARWPAAKFSAYLPRSKTRWVLRPRASLAALSGSATFGCEQQAAAGFLLGSGRTGRVFRRRVPRAAATRRSIQDSNIFQRYRSYLTVTPLAVNMAAMAILSRSHRTPPLGIQTRTQVSCFHVDRQAGQV